MENARILLSVRCCGIVSFFQPEAAGDGAAIEQEIIQDMSTSSQEQLRRMWLQYLAGDKRPDAFLEDLLQILPQPSTKSSEPDDSDHHQLLASVNRLPMLIADPERRTALQLAFLQRFPKIRTPCCGARMCFRCKTYDWHQETCEERQRREVGQKVCFCPHCGVPTVKSEGCDHMVCVCGRDWTWGMHPLVSMLQAGRILDIKPLLTQLADINAPLEGLREPPIDLFVRQMPSGPESVEVVKLFAKLGARASPHVHRERLWDALREQDRSLLELLLGSFLGVSPLDLTKMVEESITALCGPCASETQSEPFFVRRRDMHVEIALLLIQHGASVSEAAWYFHSLSMRQRSRCPIELVKVLGPVPFACDPAFVDSVDSKFVRAQDMCTSKLRKERRRAHTIATLTHRAGMKRVRPRGGKRKCGFIEIE